MVSIRGWDDGVLTGEDANPIIEAGPDRCIIRNLRLVECLVEDFLLDRDYSRATIDFFFDSVQLEQPNPRFTSLLHAP